MIAEATAQLACSGLQPVNAHSAPAMRAFLLPQGRAAQAEDAAQLMRDLWRAARIQVAAMVLDKKLLPMLVGQLGANESRDDVGGTAGRKWDDYPDWTFRPSSSALSPRFHCRKTSKQ